MDTIKLKAYINRSRQLTMELPPSFPIGEVEITIQAPLELYIAHGAHAWSEDELNTLFDFNPTKARNLTVGGWRKDPQPQTVRFIDPSQRKR